MKKIYALLLFISIPISIFALNYLQPEKLYDHLYEVNKEWAKQKISPELQQIYFFDSDESRIQKHLQLVEQHLRENMPTGLSSEQLKNRNDMLDVLNQYWNAKQFPKNLYHSRRQPYFIDDYGNACAVGYLIIASGYGEVAEKIRKENNYAFIRELLHYEELPQWAEQFGFTIDELAWIQPGYQSTIPTEPLGSGTNGTVKDILVTSWFPLKLYAAGDFSDASGTICNGIAKWDGINWSALGNGLNGTIEGMAYGGQMYELIVYGSFNNGQDQLAKWNGSTWSYESIISGKMGGATAYIFDYLNGEYLAGWYDDNGQTIYYVAEKATTWQLLEEFNGRINTMIDYGALYVAGNFTATNTGTVLNYVAKNDLISTSGFTQMGAGLDNEVKVLKMIGNAIYAGGGCFDTQKNATFCLSKYFNGQWQQLVNPQYMSWDSSFAYVNAVENYNGDLLIGGEFDVTGGLNYGRNLAFVEETGNYAIPYGSFDSSVLAIKSYTDIVYVGGAFSNINGQARNNIAAIPKFTGIPSVNELNVKVYPNPTNDMARIEFQNHEEYDVQVYSLMGQHIEVPIDEMGSGYNIHCEELLSGIYFIKLYQQGKAVAQTKLSVVK